MRHASGDGQKGRQVDDLNGIVMPDLHLGVQEHEIADGLLVHVNRSPSYGTHTTTRKP